MRSRSRDTGNVDLADVVDAVAQHREPLQTVADTDRDVAHRIASEMSHDPVGEHAPGGQETSRRDIAGRRYDALRRSG